MEAVTDGGGGGPGPNPLDDPRAAQLLGANPSEVDDLARIFGVIGNTATSMASNLGKIATAPDWSGSAYDDLNSSIGTISPMLTKVGSGFTEVAAAISHYSGVLDTTQQEFQGIKKQLDDLNHQYSQLNQTYNSESTTLQTDSNTASSDATNNAAKSVIKADGKAVSTDTTDLDNTWGSMVSIQNQLDELQPKGMNVLDRFSDARTHVNSHVSSYTGQAPKAPSHGFSVLHFGGDILKGALHGIESIPGDILSIPDDVKNFAEHPSLANMTKLLKDTAIAASTLSVAGGLGSSLLEGAGEGVVDATIDGATEEGAGDLGAGAAGELDGSPITASQRLNSIANGLDNTSKAINTANGGIQIADGHPVDGIISLAPVGKISDKLGVGDESIQELENQKTVLKQVGQDLEDGNSPQSVLEGLTPDQQETLASVGAVPVTKQGADNLVSSTESKITQAQHNYNTTGRALNSVQDGGVDGGKDVIKDKYGDGDREPAGASAG